MALYIELKNLISNHFVLSASPTLLNNEGNTVIVLYLFLTDSDDINFLYVSAVSKIYTVMSQILKMKLFGLQI